MRKFAREQEEIAEFCELGDYLDLPLRTYSSGMRVRLAFAVSTAVDAQILLLDEVMGVGDASFMHKAQERLEDLHSRAEIVVLAMHANSEIRRVCNKALWMDRGRCRHSGRWKKSLQLTKRRSEPMQVRVPESPVRLLRGFREAVQLRGGVLPTLRVAMACSGVKGWQECVAG